MTLPDIGNMADPLLLQVPHGRRVQKRNPGLHLRFAILFGNTITARNEYCVSYALRLLYAYVLLAAYLETHMNESINRNRSGKVTEASVAEAARKLLEAGQTPTLAAVLQILGGGSQNLASRLLREWKERQPKVRAAEFQVDPRISDLIAEQLSIVSKAAASAAETRAEQAEESLKLCEGEAQELQEEVDRLDGALASLQDQHQQQGGLVQALRGEIADVRADAEKQISMVKREAEEEVADAQARAERERESAELARTALAKAELRLEALPRLEAEIERLRVALETAQAGKQAAEQLAAVLAAQEGAASARVEDLVTRLEIAEKRAQEAAQEAKVQAVAAGEASRAGLAATTQLEAAQRELGGLRDAMAEAKAELKEIKAELKAARTGKKGDEK